MSTIFTESYQLLGLRGGFAAKHWEVFGELRNLRFAGAMADGIVSAGFGFFLLFYLTAVCGMSGAMAGTAKMIALLIDSVLDPAIGLASDRIRSRLGRRLPFMMASLLQ